MAEPFIYVSTWRIREGKFAEYARFYEDLVGVIRESEPQIIAFHGFTDEARGLMTSIQVHPDAASMDRHLGVLAEKIGLFPDDMTAVLQFLEPEHFEVYGTRSERVTEMDRQHREAGVPFTFMPHHVAGFNRSSGD